MNKVINIKALNDFAAKHATSRSPLADWVAKTETAEWHNTADVKATFRTVDFVKVASGARVAIFNIHGNDYRLIGSINFGTHIVAIQFVLTHREYDKGKWKRL